MHDRMRLRDALAAAIDAARSTSAPERILTVLCGAYRAVESTRTLDDDLIRWAEAGLAAWRRWLMTRPAAGSRRRILVVDHDETLTRLVRSLVDESTFTVDRASTRQEMLERLATTQPDVLFWDQDLKGGLPGVDILEWLEANLPTVRRIACTAHEATLKRLLERGLLHSALAKPLTRDSLQQAFATADRGW